MSQRQQQPITSLRVVSDTLLSDLELLQTLEEEKRGIPPENPRFLDLAHQIEELAGHVLEASAAQRAAGEGIVGSDAPDGAVPIADAPRRSMHEILAQWREAEQRLSAAERGSLEASVARSDVERLRAEYQRAHRTVLDDGGPAH